MSYFLSDKFERKLVWVNSLSELQTHVSLAHVDIPEAVFRFNMQFEDSLTTSNINASFKKQNGMLFGNSLGNLMGEHGENGIPVFIKQCMEHTLNKGLRIEGLFRRSPASATLNKVKCFIEEGQEVDITQYEVHVAATLLKVFTRDLREPIFPESSYGLLSKMSLAESDEAKVRYIKEHVLPLLPVPNQHFFCYLCKALSIVNQHHNENKMNSVNLSLVWTPNLLRSSNPMLDMSLCTQNGTTFGTVLRLSIDYQREVFSDIDQSALGMPEGFQL
ncbi:hypothetical protein DSO57_1031172 [Entomophthora muscae]|nr:hypothetical protein DSO57_1031172 [Entomophthora muscae]